MYINSIKTSLTVAIRVSRGDTASETWQETLEYRLRKRFNRDAKVSTTWKPRIGNDGMPDGGILTARITFEDEVVTEEYADARDALDEIVGQDGPQLLLQLPEQSAESRDVSEKSPALRRVINSADGASVADAAVVGK